MGEIEKITSRDNQHLVNARKVRGGQGGNQIFIEGRRLVEEALMSGIVIDECFYVDGFRDRELLARIAARTSRIYEIPERIFRTVADVENPQGTILLGQRPGNGRGIIEKRMGSQATALAAVLFLNEISNPANLGAILRTADAAGVAGVIVSENSADAFSPKGLRAAMGSSFRLPIWENVEFDEVLRWAKKWNLTSTAADVRAEKNYFEIDWRRPRLLIFGSEAHGLNKMELTAVDEQLHIPMENGVESLNLAVSAGIILFEAKRQNAEQS